jgi:predicted O-methyltransferase YrrM
MSETKIIDERIAITQYEPEFERLLQEYIALGVTSALEIGSYFGYSLHHWLYYSSQDATVVSIDLPISDFCGKHDPRVPVQEYAIANEWKLWTKRNKNKLYLIQSASQLETTKQEAIKLNQEKPFDFVFIDGDHRYEAVKKDFEMYSSMVRPGGIVALHDIGYAEEGGVHSYWDSIKNDFKHLELRLHPKNEKGIGIVYIQ